MRKKNFGEYKKADVNQKIEQWGEKKFVPFEPTQNNPFNQPQQSQFKKAVKDIKTERIAKSKPTAKETTHKNPFSQPQQFNRFNNDRETPNRYKKINKDNERIKFNPIARDARPDNATPWKRFKDEITYKQREEEQASKQANMDTEEGKQILKQREMGYRKMLMDQKKQEPTTWEDFGEDNGGNDGQSGKKSKKRKNRNNKSQPAADNLKDTQMNKNLDPFKNKMRKNKTSASVTVDLKDSANSMQPKRELISKDVLKNFDSSKLNFHQKNKIRAIMTRTICTGKSSLAQTVNNKQFQLKKIKLKAVSRTK